MLLLWDFLSFVEIYSLWDNFGKKIEIGRCIYNFKKIRLWDLCNLMNIFWDLWVLKDNNLYV